MLKYWFPMVDGTIKNQGVSDVDITDTNIVANDNGKLGKCCEFNGTDSQILWYDDIEIGNVLKSDFTICFWIYDTKGAARSDYFTTYNLSVASQGFSIEKNASKTFRLYWQASPDYSIPASIFTVPDSEWVHMCVVHHNNDMSVYANGNLLVTTTVGTYTSDKVKTYTKAALGRDTRTTTPAFKGYMNDFRLYDEALSPKIIKEIAKGLVCHYTLSNTQAKNLIDKNNISAGYLNASGAIVNTSGWYYTDYISLTPNTSYIASSISSGGSGTYYVLYNADKVLTRSVAITANQNSTFTTTASEYYVRFSLRNLNNELETAQLEKGTDITEYQEYYPPWLFNDSQEDDVSGYGHDGIFYTTDGAGEFIYETESPRYNHSLRIYSLNSTSNAKAGTAYFRADCQLITPNQLTIAFWCYARNQGYGGNTSQGVFCTSNNDGDSVGTDYQTSAMNHRDSTVNVNPSSGSQITLPITFTANVWRHYVFTYDGQVAKSYVDGELFGTKSFSAATPLGTFKHVVLGFSRAGGVWRRNNNTYSDLRVYATALSEDDVMELYHAPIHATKTATLMTQGEFVEVV